MIEECDAAIIINNADLAFGCMGCARSRALPEVFFNSAKRHTQTRNAKLLRKTRTEGTQFVTAIKRFLTNLRGKTMTAPVLIAPLSCGPPYSGVQEEMSDGRGKIGHQQNIFPGASALKDIIRDFDAFWALK